MMMMMMMMMMMIHGVLGYLLSRQTHMLPHCPVEL